MKQLNTEVNSSQFFILTGIEFDVNRVLQKENKDHIWKKSQKVTLKQIIESELIPLTKSSDERFDKKCPIVQAAESLLQNGLPMHLIEKVMKQKSYAEKGTMVGPHRFLNHLITREHKEFIDRKLEECWDYYKNNAEMP